MKLRLNDVDPSNIWLTSDQHFGHGNIAGPDISSWNSGYRDFKSVEEMDKTILECINKYVPENGILFSLGDFTYGTKIGMTFRHKINCQTIYHAMGNHDKLNLMKKMNFTDVQDAYLVTVGNIRFYAQHYACRVWPGSHRGSFHAYGHSHNSLADDWGKSMDVGIDSIYAKYGEYRPINLIEFVDRLSNKPIKFIDHHV